jgi:hypothetical protein
MLAGVRAGLAITLVLACAATLIVRKVAVAVERGPAADIRGVWGSFPWPLRKLLVSDIIIRTCESLSEIFIVLYVTNVLGRSLAAYALLVAVQQATSMIVYVPSAKIADRIGRKPFVVATFVGFALFPVAVALSAGTGALAIAFVIGGLREIGEPARKAMIVDFAAPHEGADGRTLLPGPESHDRSRVGDRRAALGNISARALPRRRGRRPRRRRSFRGNGQRARRELTGHYSRAILSVSAISASRIPGSIIECPESGTTNIFASGQALCRSHAENIGQTTS